MTVIERRLLHPDPMVRRLSWMVLVNTIGNGLFVTASVLFFTRIVGLGAGAVGLGLTLAGVCGVAASIPAGRAADRWGSRRVLITLCVVQAAGLSAYFLVHSFAAFLLVVCVETATDRAAATARNTLYADVLSPAGRVAGRAYLRAVTNVGYGAGAALAAIALQIDTRAAYLTLIAADAVTFLAVAVILRWIPATPARVHTADEGSRRGALTDRPYLLITALNAVLSLQFAVLTVGLPLWIVRETSAPPALVGATLLLNTVLVVVFQVRAARTAEDIPRAARACRAAGLLLAGYCLVIAVSDGLPAIPATAVLLAAVALGTAGEVLSQAGGWLLSYDLADGRATGAYQGVFNAGTASGLMIGPVAVTATAIDHPPWGWAVPAALFLAAGLAMVPAARWAAHRHPAAAGPG
ncbi:MFS transporter [Actinoplanes sp. HUAS TT8]|uniref:MFS transporter n=1 Tax=Actinoplanes sp. HUAS TT8 TaxID=3447453 RepID=UPI003F5268E6